MTTTERSMTTTRDAPIVGVFDDIGEAEHAVRRLHEAGFSRGDVALGFEQVEAAEEETPAPPSLALPYAFVCSLLGGAACGLLAAFFAPPTVTIQGFGWTVSTVLILSLVGGLFGWMLGAILGFGDVSKREREDVPGLVPMTEPVATVTVQSPGRPEEARTILRSIGAREVRGGTMVRPDPKATQYAQRTSPLVRDAVLARPRRGVAAGQAGGVVYRPAQTTAHAKGKGKGNRAGIAIGVVVVAGAVLGLLGLRKKD